MNNKRILYTTLAIGSIAILCATASCKTIPKGMTPVKDLDVNKYLGKWYEIARLDFKFEKNMTNTTAHYSLNDNGSIKVVNEGYDTVKNENKKSEGVAKLVGEEKEGKLKVSFFGPFYSPYNIIAIEDNYKYALIMGKNTDYLWILSREKSVPKKVKDQFLQKAIEAGYDVEKLVWVSHD